MRCKNFSFWFVIRYGIIGRINERKTLTKNRRHLSEKKNRFYFVFVGTFCPRYWFQTLSSKCPKFQHYCNERKRHFLLSVHVFQLLLLSFLQKIFAASNWIKKNYSQLIQSMQVLIIPHGFHQSWSICLHVQGPPVSCPPELMAPITSEGYCLLSKNVCLRLT